MHTTTTTTTRVGVTRCGNWQWRSRTSGVRRVRTLYQENNTSFSERELVRLSVVCLSVTFVHPTQATDGVTLFFRQKIDDLFSHTSRSQKVATPTLILILPIDRFSFVKFSRKKCDFHQCVTPPLTPWMVSPGVMVLFALSSREFVPFIRFTSWFTLCGPLPCKSSDQRSADKHMKSWTWRSPSGCHVCFVILQIWVQWCVNALVDTEQRQAAKRLPYASDLDVESAFSLLSSTPTVTQ